VLRLIVAENILAPAHRSRLRVDTTKFTGGAESIEATVIPSRCCSGPVAGRVAVFSIPTLQPKFAAGVDVVSRHHFLLAPLFNRVSSPVSNRKRGITDSGWLLPEW